jgi:alkyl sulfatase BDS1-like metallo-beta-lactamase superfamily hydrolase
MGEAKTESENIIDLINASVKAQKVLAAENWQVILQFDLDGEDKPFFIEVKNGKANLHEGTHSEPTVLITGDGASIARASRGQGDFTHSISREEVEIKKGKVMELIRYGRAISAALKEKRTKK